jgi:uncharacterized membrane protein
MAHASTTFDDGGGQHTTRPLYVLAGGLMLLYGWKRGKLLGTILMFAGSNLIARGLTGKSLHQALNDWAREGS